jgi:hypothetical protein
MSFVYDLADTRYKTQVFYQSGTWIKPQGITMVSITAIGAGGGGGGGLTGAVTTTRTGGGGGGSGGITRLIIPEMFITDLLRINIGLGGAGGSAGGGSGVKGGDTSVDMSVNGNGDIYTFVVVASGGTGDVGGVGGAGATAANVAQALYSTLGQWFAIGGQTGDPGANGAGNFLTYGATIGLPIMAGAGGGGMAANNTGTTAGGGIAFSAFGIVLIQGAAAGNGPKGLFSLTPFYSLGGCGGGGGGTTPVSGGVGGDGGPGSGGGGGGGGTTPTGVGGVGGRGGNGLVIIQCW